MAASSNLTAERGTETSVQDDVVAREVAAVTTAIEQLRQPNGRSPARSDLGRRALLRLEEIDHLLTARRQNGRAATAAVRATPTRPEIEAWLRRQLSAGEEHIWSSARNASRELTKELGELVEAGEQRATRRLADAEAAAEYRLRDQALRYAEEARLETEERIREAQEKLSRRARRHELKLARQERDRRIRAAERRLEARVGASRRSLSARPARRNGGSRPRSSTRSAV